VSRRYTGHPIGQPRSRCVGCAASPVERDVVWVGTEPSELWRSADAGTTWQQTSRLEILP